MTTFPLPSISTGVNAYAEQAKESQVFGPLSVLMATYDIAERRRRLDATESTVWMVLAARRGCSRSRSAGIRHWLSERFGGAPSEACTAELCCVAA